VAISIFNWDTQHESIKELIELGAVTFFRRPFYPKLSVRIKKKILNFFLLKGKKNTYHNVLYKFQPDQIYFNLAGGTEIVEDSEDLLIFIKQLKIPFSVFYHSISTKNKFDEITKANFQFVINKSKVSLFTSKWQALEYEKQLDLKITNKLILNHPIREINQKNQLSLDKVETQFCIIGSLVNRWKGQDIAIKALSSHFEKNWHLNLYGEGEDNENLIDLIKSLNLNDRVTFHGYESDINKIFQKNDLLLIPSRQDSGPIALFEGMLAGLPIIGTPIGAMPEYVINDFNGVLSTDNHESSFCDALDHAFKNKHSWKAWGA
jgi:glycosyltransferase involved in cell wall biosynthesis